MGIATAIVGSAIIGAAVTKNASDKATSANTKAASAATNAQLESSKLQLAEITRQFNYQMEVLQPQVAQQLGAQQAYGNMLGVTPGQTPQIPGTGQPGDKGGFLGTKGIKPPPPGANPAPVGNFIQPGQRQPFTDPNLDPTRLSDNNAYSESVRSNPLAAPTPGQDSYINHIQGTTLQAERMEDDVFRTDVGTRSLRDDVAGRSLETGVDGSRLAPGVESRRIADGAAGTSVYGNEFQTSPGYEFQVEEMERQLERVGSAGGPNIGGRAVMEAMRRGKGLADSEYYNWASGRERDLGRLGNAEAADINRIDSAYRTDAGRLDGARSADASRIDSATGTDIARLDNAGLRYADQGNRDVARMDSAQLNYIQRQGQDIARGDSAAQYQDSLEATDLQRSDQGYYNYMQQLAGLSGFGGGPAAQAFSVSGNQGNAAASIHANQGNQVGNIQSNAYLNQGNIDYQEQAGYNNFFQGAMNNYVTANQAGMFNPATTPPASTYTGQPGPHG